MTESTPPPTPAVYDDWFEARLKETESVLESLRKEGLYRGLAARTGIQERIFLHAFGREFVRSGLGRPFSLPRALTELGKRYLIAIVLLLRSFLRRRRRVLATDWIMDEWAQGAFENFGYSWLMAKAGITRHAIVCTVAPGKGPARHKHPAGTVFCQVENRRRYRTAAVTQVFAGLLVAGIRLLRLELRLRRHLTPSVWKTVGAYWIFDDLFSVVQAPIYLTGQDCGMSPVAYGCFKKVGGKVFCVMQNGSQTFGPETVFTMGDVLVNWGPLFTRLYKRNRAVYKRYCELGSLKLHRFMDTDCPARTAVFDVCCAGFSFLHEGLRERPDCAERMMEHLARLSIEEPGLRIAYCAHPGYKNEKDYIDKAVPGHKVVFPKEPSYAVMMKSRMTLSVISSVVVEAASAGVPVWIFDYTGNPRYYDNGDGPELPRVRDLGYETFHQTILEILRNGTPVSYSHWFSPVRVDYAEAVKNAVDEALTQCDAESAG